MKKASKRTLFISMFMFFTFMTLNMGIHAEAANGVSQRLNALKSKFPDGRFWNHQVTAYSNNADVLMANWNESYADSTTTSPCATHNGSASVGQFDCNFFDGGIQCYGFARKVFYDVFGQRVSSLPERHDVQNIVVGDYIRTGGHSGVVLSRSGDTIRLVECNFSLDGPAYNCLIRWGIVSYSIYNVTHFMHATNYSDVDNPHTHSYSSKVTKQPTCTAAGIKTFTCSCGSSYTEQIAAAGHKYTTQKVAPTVTEKGYTLHKCSVCGNSYKDNYIDPPKADGGWYYCDTLPSGVTSDKYRIEYNNYYEKTQSTSPGSGWTNVGTVKNEWQNSGAPYKSNTDLATSDSRILVSSVYYHWCGPTMGGWGNYEQSGGYVHYDQIPADWVNAQLHGYDNGHPYYYLYWSNGPMVYCKTGDTCDGSWGWHGTRCASWYKENTYQDRTKVMFCKYTKESGWTGSRDNSATKVTYRYKEKDMGLGMGSPSIVPTTPETNVSKTPAVQVTPETNASKPSVPQVTPETNMSKPSAPEIAPETNTPQAVKPQTQKSQQTRVTLKRSEKSAAASLKKGDHFTVGGLKYSVTKGGANGKAQAKVAGVSKTGVSSLTIPATVKYRGVSCTVTAVGSKAFVKCGKLKKVTVEKNVKSIGAKAFYGCRKLKNITIRTTKLTKKTVGSKAFEKISKNAVIRVPDKCLKTYKKILRAKGADKSVKIKK